MSDHLVVKSWQVECQDYVLNCYWMPGSWASDAELAHLTADIDYVNETSGPLRYGFFSPTATPKQRQLFLAQTIWCVVYKGGKPCGFVYQYNLGKVQGERALHFGLVKLNHHPGKDFIRVPYVALGLGNLLNFGAYYATNVSHVPAIIDMFGDMVHEVYPSFVEQDVGLRQSYAPVLQALRESYLVPILDYDPKALDERAYKVKDSLKDGGSGFQTNWKSVPKSQSTLCNLFVKEWLGVHEQPDGSFHIQDDLIQIGRVDFRYYSNPRMQAISNLFRYRPLQGVAVMEAAKTEAVQELQQVALKKGA